MQRLICVSRCALSQRLDPSPRTESCVTVEAAALPAGRGPVGGCKSLRAVAAAESGAMPGLRPRAVFGRRRVSHECGEEDKDLSVYHSGARTGVVNVVRSPHLKFLKISEVIRRRSRSLSALQLAFEPPLNTIWRRAATRRVRFGALAMSNGADRAPTIRGRPSLFPELS